LENLEVLKLPFFAILEAVALVIQTSKSAKIIKKKENSEALNV